MITVCVIWDGEQEKLNKNAEPAWKKQGPDFQKEIRLKILCGKSEDEVESSLSGQAEYFSDRIKESFWRPWKGSSMVLRLSL